MIPVAAWRQVRDTGSGMAGQPAYPAARAAAIRVRPHYTRNADASFVPHVEIIEAMIDVAFWASLRREETYTPKVSLAFIAPGQVETPLVFERPVPLASQPLTRLGPAVERPGIHLCVHERNGVLLVWGATRNPPRSCFVLEVVGPGLLVVKKSRNDDSGKFVNVAVLQGDEIKVIDQRAAAAPDCPGLLTSLLGMQTDDDSPDSTSILIQLAISMRAHGRGGSLLVVPSGTEAWRESMLQPIAYAVTPSFRVLAGLMAEESGDRAGWRWQDAVVRAVDGIAGLTAVDGATVINDRYELLGFGAKIVRRIGRAQVGSVTVTEPIEGTGPVLAEPGQLGGTRHLSAAQFVHDQKDAMALVASQDGRFTVFAWSPCAKAVYANRIETLLL